MERIRSRVGRALGGAGRLWGGGLLAAAVLAGAGCTGLRGGNWSASNMFATTPPKPATAVVTAFMPQVQYLPDPTHDGMQGAGVVGQLFLVGNDGNYVPANGELVAMMEDTTPRPAGGQSMLAEVYHFDATTLKKLKTKDERFGDCYALFLPYPKEWKDVTEVRLSAKYTPVGEKALSLSSPPQVMRLDFTPPGSKPDLMADAAGKPTAPVQMRGIPNLPKDFARGGVKPASPTANPNTGTVPAGGVLPPTTPGTPTAGGSFAPLADVPLARGPNGQPYQSTAVALQPGQTMPDGWRKDANGAIIVPPATGTAWPNQSANPRTTTYPPTNPPLSTLPPSTPPVVAPLNGLPSYPPTTGGVPSALPPLPASAVPGSRPGPQPDPTIPTLPPLPPDAGSGVIAPPPPPNFDPRSPVGSWANPPAYPPGSDAPPPVTKVIQR